MDERAVTWQTLDCYDRSTNARCPQLLVGLGDVKNPRNDATTGHMATGIHQLPLRQRALQGLQETDCYRPVNVSNCDRLEKEVDCLITCNDRSTSFCLVCVEGRAQKKLKCDI